MDKQKQTTPNRLDSADYDISKADDAPDTSGVICVNHGTSSDTARPEVSGIVMWIGSAEPANAKDGDIWQVVT